MVRRGLLWGVLLATLLGLVVPHAETGESPGNPVYFTGPDELDVPALKIGGVPVTSGGTIFAHATDCTTGITTAKLNDTCVDDDDGRYWICRSPETGGNLTRCDLSSEWSPVAGPVAIAFANLPLDPPDGSIFQVVGTDPFCQSPGTDVVLCWWNGAEYGPVSLDRGPVTLRGAMANGNDISPTVESPLVYTGTVPTGDTDCQVYFEAAKGWIYENCGIRIGYQGQAKRLKTIWLVASALKADGAQCVTTADVTINGSYPEDVIVCADNPAAIVYSRLLRMPRSWDCGALSASLGVADVDSASQVSGWLFSAQVRNFTALSSTWGTPSAASSVTMTTAHIPYGTSLQSFTPSGTCFRNNLNNYLVVRAVKDSAGVDTDDGDARILGLTIQYRIEGDSDE